LVVSRAGVEDAAGIAHVIARKIAYAVHKALLLKKGEEGLHLNAVKMVFRDDHVKAFVKEGNEIEAEDIGNVAYPQGAVAVAPEDPQSGLDVGANLPGVPLDVIRRDLCFPYKGNRREPCS